MTRPHNTRRAFTLLELGLATLVSSIVLLATLSLFNAIERTDRKLEGRFERSAEIERTRRAFQKAFASIATSETAEPRVSGSPNSPGGASGRQSPQIQPPSSKQGDTAKASESDAGSSLPPAPPPRVVLGPDTGIDSDPSVSALGAQRLELVLANTPVATIKRASSEEARMAMGDDDAPPSERAGGKSAGEKRSSSAGSEDNRVDPSAAGGSQAIRGAFSFRSQTTPAGRDARSDLATRPLMELWWVPLPPAQTDPDAEPLPMSMAAGYPTKLCSDVVGSRIRFFREGQWIMQHTATWWRDLPAYAEVQMDFANGTSVRWLMEIDYTVLAEVISPDPENATGTKPGSSATPSGSGSPGGLRGSNVRKVGQ